MVGVLPHEIDVLGRDGPRRRWLGDGLSPGDVVAETLALEGRSEVRGGNRSAHGLRQPRRRRVANLAYLLAMGPLDHPISPEALQPQQLWDDQRTIVPVEGARRRSRLRGQGPRRLVLCEL